MKVFVCCESDIGNYRSINQDSIGIFRDTASEREAIFAIVCDGVGGLQNGEYASRETVEGMKQWFYYEYPQLKNCDEETEDFFRNRMEKALREQNERIFEYGVRNQKQMGTTATALLLEPGGYHIVHIGDSRIYEISDKIIQLTEDHSLLAQEVRCGRITAEEAKHDKRSNILLQCVGYKKEIVPFYGTGMTKLATYLICTDGFFRKLEEKDLLELSPKEIDNESALEKKVSELIEKAKQRGERDNLSAIAIVVKDRRGKV